VKYEEVHLKEYDSATDARNGPRNYSALYNTTRTHLSLSSQTPIEVYLQTSGPREVA
jgi:putative transposase